MSERVRFPESSGVSRDVVPMIAEMQGGTRVALSDMMVVVSATMIEEQISVGARFEEVAQRLGTGHPEVVGAYIRGADSHINWAKLQKTEEALEKLRGQWGEKFRAKALDLRDIRGDGSVRESGFRRRLKKLLEREEEEAIEAKGLVHFY